MKSLKEHEENVQEVLIILMQRCFSKQAKEGTINIDKHINTSHFLHTHTNTLKTYSETKNKQQNNCYTQQKP